MPLSSVPLSCIAQVVRAFQKAPPKTREFDLRLLEIASASINTIGGMLFISCHPYFEIRPEWERAKVSHGHLFYVQFYHRWYKNHEIYPPGLLNVVGYWAETQIFGGVVLFERGNSGSEVRLGYWPHTFLMAVERTCVDPRVDLG